MRYEVVRNLEKLQMLSAEWNGLVARSRSDSIFQTWQWLETWLELRSPSPEPLVICVRNESGSLVGLAPYYKVGYRLGGLIPYRVLRVLGDTDCGAEYQSWIADRAEESEVFGQIGAALQACKSEWDLIWMPRLKSWTGTQAPVLEVLKECNFDVNVRPSPFAGFTLPESFEAYLKQMSSNRRQQVRRMSRKILDNPNVEICKVESPAEVEPALAALFELHGKRWRAIGESGVFARNAKEKQFYERFTRKALAQGWLAMYTLLDSGEPKAVQFGYIYGDAFLQLQEGFDPDYSPHVGNVLRAHIIEECIKLGLREYDFLGGHSEHKRRWLSEEREGMDLLATSLKVKNIPIVRGSVWPTGAYLRPHERANAPAGAG